MAGKPLFVLLCSGEHEKIQMAAMIASVGAVSERAVTVFVSMDAIFAFEKGVEADKRYKGGRFSKIMLDNNAPDAVELFGQGKMLGEMDVYACSMAVGINGWTLDNLVDDLFDGEMGLTKFLSDAESGELITL